MRLDFHRHFDRQYKKLSGSKQKQFRSQLGLFISNQNSAALNNHALKGKYLGYRSINVSGDLRAIFIQHSKKHIEFVYIGTHSQLYK